MEDLVALGLSNTRLCDLFWSFQPSEFIVELQAEHRESTAED